MVNNVILYSHGFGVRKDDRGLFTDIASSMPEAEHIMFNYNLIDEPNNTLTASPLQDQVKKLNAQLANILDLHETSSPPGAPSTDSKAVLSDGGVAVATPTAEKEVLDGGGVSGVTGISRKPSKEPGKTIDIVAHSQGCLVAAMAKAKNVRKIVCIAAPSNAGADRLIKYFSDYNGSPINTKVESKIKRRDGSTTIIPVAYWHSLRELNVMAMYNSVAEYSKITIICANQDEVLGATDFSAASERIKLINIDGNHDFNGTERQTLVKIVKEELIGDKP